MKKLYIVLGAESTGTRYFTEILVKSGIYGDYGHEQRLDTESATRSPIVIRRSYPHKQKYPSLSELIGTFGIKPSEIFVYITIRDFHCACSSSIANGHILDKTFASALLRYQKAYKLMLRQIDEWNLDYVFVNYESLWNREYIAALFAIGNITNCIPNVIDYIDGDSKYY